jgi:hypothetical protein
MHRNDVLRRSGMRAFTWVPFVPFILLLRVEVPDPVGPCPWGSE